jgi:quinol monooxygenase YgiN
MERAWQRIDSNSQSSSETSILQRLTSLRLSTILAVCLAGTAARSADNQAEPMKVLTFIEVRGDAVDRGRNLLRRYAQTLRRSGQALHIETLEEIGRPERFVILESATRADELTASGLEIADSMKDVLTAPPDRRNHRELVDVPATTVADAAPTSVSSALFMIAHLDIGPPDQGRGVAALRLFVDAARHSPGNLRFEAWQQTNRPNHFNLVGCWTSRAKLDEFSRGAAAREYRESVGPLIGSLYDERLYRLVVPK